MIEHELHHCELRCEVCVNAVRLSWTPRIHPINGNNRAVTEKQVVAVATGVISNSLAAHAKALVDAPEDFSRVANPNKARLLC